MGPYRVCRTSIQTSWIMGCTAERWQYGSITVRSQEPARKSGRFGRLLAVASVLWACWVALPAMACMYMPAVEVDDLLSGDSWKGDVDGVFEYQQMLGPQASDSAPRDRYQSSPATGGSHPTNQGCRSMATTRGSAAIHAPTGHPHLGRLATARSMWDTASGGAGTGSRCMTD